MKNPFLLAGLTIMLWSFGSYLARLISIKAEFVFLSISFAFSFLTLLVYALIESRSSFFGNLKNIPWIYFLIGPFGYFIYSIALNLSFREFNSASETTILNYTWPVFTVIFTQAVFKGIKSATPGVRLIEVLGVVFGFLSVFVLATNGNWADLSISNLKGLLWGLLAGASYGFFSAYSSTVPKEKQSIFLLVSVTLSLVLMGLVSIPELTHPRTFTITDILVVFFLGCVLNGVGYITWTRANRVAREKDINISSVASLMFILPILSLLIIAILLGETTLFEPYFILSLILVFLSMVLCQRSSALDKYITPRSRHS